MCDIMLTINIWYNMYIVDQYMVKDMKIGELELGRIRNELGLSNGFLDDEDNTMTWEVDHEATSSRAVMEVLDEGGYHLIVFSRDDYRDGMRERNVVEFEGYVYPARDVVEIHSDDEDLDVEDAFQMFIDGVEKDSLVAA